MPVFKSQIHQARMYVCNQVIASLHHTEKDHLLMRVLQLHFFLLKKANFTHVKHVNCPKSTIAKYKQFKASFL